MFDPEDFRARKGDILRYFDKKGVSYGAITEYCSLSMIPIPVVCTFIAEEFPEHEEMCRDKITDLKEFYGY